MRLRFRPEARLDLLEASAWYEERSPGLGAEFARAVDVTTAGILRFPESFPTAYDDVRMAVLRRFPYALLYVVDSERGEIIVLACFHHRRDPTDWPGRSD